MDPFTELEIKKASDLRKPETTPKEKTPEEKASEREMQCCLHLKRVIQSYFTRGVSTKLKLNVAGLGEKKLEQLMNMFMDNGYEVIISGHIMEINPLSE